MAAPTALQGESHDGARRPRLAANWSDLVPRLPAGLDAALRTGSATLSIHVMLNPGLVGDLGPVPVSVLRWVGLCLALMSGACTQAELTKENVVGPWVVDNSGHAGQSRATLELKDDGTFVATALPGDIVEIGDEATVDTSGRWRLSTRGDAQVIQMDFLLPDGQGGRKVWGNQLDFMGSSPSLALLLHAGRSRER